MLEDAYCTHSKSTLFWTELAQNPKAKSLNKQRYTIYTGGVLG